MNIFISDVDGTTLKRKEKDFSIETKNAFKSIIDSNNLLIIASGRTYQDLYKLFNHNDNIIYIAENGNLIVDKGKIIYTNKFEYKIARDLIRHLWNLKYFDYILVSTPLKAYYIDQKGDVYIDYIIEKVKSNLSIESFIDYIEGDIIKISICKKEITPKYYELYKSFSNLFPNIEVFDANNNWIDLSPRDGNKGEAVKFILKNYNFKYENLYIFGDGENDISMLRLTKNSYCPISSLEIVKKNSTYVYSDFSKVIESLLNL